MEPDEGDGNMVPRSRVQGEVVKWSGVSPAAQVKLLFLLDSGDKSSGGTDHFMKLNTEAATEAKEAFLSVLKDKKYSFKQVTEVLKNRIRKVRDYPIISMASGTQAANWSLRKDDEDLLTLVQACHYLTIECQPLRNKVKKVKEKLDLTKEEMEGSSFIYAENLSMIRLCDALTPRQVAQLLTLIAKDKALGELVEPNLEVSTAKLGETPGLKEAIFFYLIRILELNDKLNRIYTDKLEVQLRQLRNQADGEERRGLSQLVTSLGDYPAGGLPAGHCVVFCVTRDRHGALGEIKKVKKVFGETLGYTVHIEEDPSEETLKDYLSTLRKPKYKFYDSIVYWFMSHGSEDTLKLADGSRIPRQTIIDAFSKLDNFRKKPKLFFMAPCQGNSTIRVKNNRGLKVALDGVDEGMTTFSVVPENCQNITAVYYQMDRLVASATLPQHYAFRLPDGGSVFVDTVCRLLEQYRGHNITEVLERVSNSMHQILFSCNTKFNGEAKQACYYESTLQKTFRVP